MQARTDTPETLAADVTVREASATDADTCGRIFYDAFASIASRHNLPVEPGSPQFTRFAIGSMLAHDGYAGLVAERGGVGTRLVQTAYHYRSLALYAKLGFAIREPLSVLQGTPPAVAIPGLGVRPAREADLEACGSLCTRVHGHDRNAELRDALLAGSACVVERPGRISGYATGFGYGWHAVAETTEDLIALLGSAEAFMGLGILVPSRNTELLGWCLANGLTIVQQSTLVTIGLYNEPTGAWLPSIAY